MTDSVKKKNPVPYRPLCSRAPGICNWCENPIPGYKRGMTTCDNICDWLWKSHLEDQQKVDRNYRAGQISKEEVRGKANKKLFGGG